jgi:tripartite-type tricarboxylate transporter receptor subunit TctC
MTRSKVFGLCLSAVAVLSLTVVACSSPAAPAPTAAPAAPKPAEPTKAAAPAAPTAAPAQPTAAPAVPKVAYPEKGKSISLIVPFGAGGSTDIGARLLAAGMEKELGVPVQVVNKGGAGSQTGLTELAGAKPDGYTIGFANLPTANLVYNDPERKANFTAKSFQPIGAQVMDPSAIGVSAAGPFKTVKDMVDAGKAKPGEVKFGSDGPMTDDHLGIFQLEKASGAKYANVAFDGSATTINALLGGHIDAAFGHVGDFLSQVKSGQMRVIAVADDQRSKYYPDTPTMIEQGYKITNSSTRTVVAPAGISKDQVDVLTSAMKKAMDAPDHKQKMDDAGLTLRYMDPTQLATFWSTMDTLAAQLVKEAKVQ